MTQTSVPFLFMRGGTSRGPYFKRDDLPEDVETLSQVLISAVGSGHGLNIDGVGGGNAVTTKVAMLSKSDDEWADVDYFFAQVSVEDKQVDYKPTCGNILSGVGPAAIEMGLVSVTGDSTEVKIRAVNTGARVLAEVQTPNGAVSYSGSCEIDGVPGTSAPITLLFKDVAGSSTGQLLPTGNAIDVIDGIEVSCVDVAMPMVIARASAFGLTGHESAQELNDNVAFFERMEAVRCKAGELMGMKDVATSVTPKFGLVSEPRFGGTLSARYFMPWSTHPTMAVTGSQCIASCVLTPGTVAAELIKPPPEHGPVTVVIEHPVGLMNVIVDYALTDNGFEHRSAGLVRTARKIVSGELYVPSKVWSR